MSSPKEIEVLEKWLITSGFDGKFAFAPAVSDEELIRQISHLDFRNIRNRLGYTPLMGAAMNGRIPVVKWLLEHDVEIDAQAKNGWTALHFAASQVQEGAMQLLLKHGANPNVPCSNGGNVLMALPPKERSDLGRLLISYGASPTMKSKGGICYLDILRKSQREADFPEYFTTSD